MNLLCKIGFHKKKEISMYKCEETDKNSDAVQNSEESPLELTLLHYWTFYHHYKCDLFEGHDGPCNAFETFEDEKPRRLIVRYTNR